MSAALTQDHSIEPPKDAVDFITSSLGSTTIRLITVDTRNELGGRGGSVDSDQCAWLVRELATASHRGVIVSTRHRSHELRNERTSPGKPARILGGELAALLLAHTNVLGWIGGHRHRPAAIRHGGRENGLWEMTPAMLGFGCEAWLFHQRRHAVHFSRELDVSVPLVAAFA